MYNAYACMGKYKYTYIFAGVCICLCSCAYLKINLKNFAGCRLQTTMVLYHSSHWGRASQILDDTLGPKTSCAHHLSLSIFILNLLIHIACDANKDCPGQAKFFP